MNHPEILVPLDFSELGELGLKAAGQYASIFSARVTPFHAYTPITDLDGFYYTGSGVKAHEKFSEIEKILRIRLQDAALKYIAPDRVGAPLLDTGNAARCIARQAESFDMVVMSSHGRSGFSRLIMGSVTEKVLRLCSKPVITVRQGSELQNFGRLLVFTDFSENSYRVFPYANYIAETSGGTIELVHVISSEQFFDEQAFATAQTERKKRLDTLVDNHFSNISHQVECTAIVSEHAPHVELAKKVADSNCNLLCMSLVGRTGLEHLLMGSTASQVIRSVNTAVLTVNPQRMDTAADG